MGERLPQGHEIKFMLFQLCDGDISKLRAIKRFTYIEALHWLCLGDFRGHLHRKNAASRNRH